MDRTKVYGIHGEGRNLCLSCAEKIYGSSLEMYVDTGELQILSDQERPQYASEGLLCDECLGWIFPPEKAEDRWWLVEPDPEEHRRLLAPFASFLETLEIDAMSLREV
jgi:hypothetical protein